MEVPILRPWVVVDAERRVLRDGTPLDADLDPLAHNGVFGWVERRDLAEACALALTAPISGAPIIHLMSHPLGRSRYDMAPAEALLGWHPRFDFAAELSAGATIPEPTRSPEEDSR